METDKSQGRGSGSRGPSPPSPGSCHIAAPLACETSGTPAAEASPLWILSLWLCFAAWAAGSGDKQGRQPRAAEWETAPRAAGCTSLARLLTHPSVPIATPTGAQMRPGTGLAALISQQGREAAELPSGKVDGANQTVPRPLASGAGLGNHGLTLCSRPPRTHQTWSRTSA